MTYLIEEQAKNYLVEFSIGKWFNLWLTLMATIIIQIPAYVFAIVMFEVGTDNSANIAM